MTDRSAPDAIVVGGGAIGLGIAWRAAREGLRVTVVDMEPGRGASWAAAGMLAPVTEVHPGEEPLLRLNLAGARRYPAWVDELQETTGLDVGYRRSGTVMAARDSDDNAALEEVHRLQRDLGLAAERLKSRAVRSQEPALAPSVRGGIWVADDHQVDNRALVTALVAACRATGVAFRAGRVERVAGAGRAEAVVLESGERLPCGQVVVAAGAWSNNLGGLAQRALPPIRPVKGQLLHLRARPGAALPRHVVRGLDVYLVPRSDGRLIVGATVEEQGFDEAVTAGGVYTLLRAAFELVPGIAEAELIEVTASVRPAAPDNAPVLGPTAVPGLVAATGHYRNGILLTPVTADLVTAFIAEGTVAPEMEPFSPARFAPARAAS